MRDCVMLLKIWNHNVRFILGFRAHQEETNIASNHVLAYHKMFPSFLMELVVCLLGLID